METKVRQEIEEIYGCLPKAETPSGYRLVFPVKYPSGRWVSVWLVERDGRLLLTDHGETVWDLEMFGYDVLSNRHYAVDEILRRYAAWREGTAFFSEYKAPQSLDGFVTALVSVASLLYTRRGKPVVKFKVEVENYLQERFSGAYAVVRRYRFRAKGKTYLVHFALRRKDDGKVPSALIHTVSARQTATLKAKRDDLLKVWWAVYQTQELSPAKRISLIDDRPWGTDRGELLEVVREIEDYLVIKGSGERLTEVLLWSEHERLAQLL